jgi:hypothetical protein
VTATLSPSAGAAHLDRPTRPSVIRRVALGVTALLSCALPTTFLVATVAQLATGTEADHRFHQVTGQGLLLCVLWLGALVPLLVSGWRGTAPSAGTALQAAAVAVTGLIAGAIAPGAGGLALAVYAAVTTGLVWAVLPVRPRLRGELTGLDPVIAPITLLGTALLTPFITGELHKQNHVHDEHTDMAHYFDMAWVSLIIVVLGVVAALVPSARRRAYWLTGGLVLIGATRMAFTPDVTWSLLAMALGAAGSVALVLRDRR